jgi:hypothetical protein
VTVEAFRNPWTLTNIEDRTKKVGIFRIPPDAAASRNAAVARAESHSISPKQVIFG